jgi:hypothetical protein
MKIKPEKRYRKPKYPTREKFILKPFLFNKFIPFCWKGKKYVTSAIAVFVLSGCARRYISSRDVIDQQEVGEKGASIQNENKKEIKREIKKGLIGPVFDHGGGRGVTGCIVISPPVFCIEEEAKRLIIEELRKGGVNIDQTDVKIEEMTIKRYRDCCTAGIVNLFGQEDKWILDGYSTELNVGFEFISTRDYWNLGSLEVYKDSEEAYLQSPILGAARIGGWSSVTSWDMIAAAEAMREKLKEYGKINAGVFYDPMLTIDRSALWDDEEWKKQKPLYDEALAFLLRKQVEDFIEWLRKEKIIDDIIGQGDNQ